MKAEKAKRIATDWYVCQVYGCKVGDKPSAQRIEQEVYDELNELERLARIGRATEKAFETWPAILGASSHIDGVGPVCFYNVDELLKWAEGEDK